MFLISSGAIIGIVVLVVVLILVFWFIGIYNKLVELRNKVRNGWSQIDVQLKRRFDLIPNLAETVKGYAKMEKDIFEQFAKARGLYAEARESGSVEKAAEANATLGNTLSRLLVVQERYPELKANTNFQEMMKQLKETEDKISFTRQFYNDTVLEYNNTLEKFPNNIVSSMFKFERAQFFEIKDEAQREAPRVQF